MKLLTDTDPNNSDYVQAFLKDVAVQEAQCFDRIFLHFALLNGIKQDITKIDFDDNPARPNYVGYYYNGVVPKSTHQRHFLMSRDLIIKPGETLPVLNIVFNASLIDETQGN